MAWASHVCRFSGNFNENGLKMETHWSFFGNTKAVGQTKTKMDRQSRIEFCGDRNSGWRNNNTG